MFYVGYRFVSFHFGFEGAAEVDHAPELLQQPFVKDGSVSVEQYMAAAAKELGGKVKFVDAVRFEKGEGIEKRQDDFAAEVASMVK